MTIRPARDADFDAIAEITNPYIETSAIHFSYEPATGAQLAELWRSHPKHPWLVSEDERGELTGYAKASVWRERAAYQWTPEVGLYVREGLHGRGLGRALYAALFDACEREGFRSVIAGITLPNDASLALHAKFGFVSIGVVREAGWKLERWHDVEFLQKMLAPAARPGAGS